MLLGFQKELAKKGIDRDYIASPVWTVEQGKKKISGQEQDVLVLKWEGDNRSYQIELEENIADVIKQVTGDEDITGTRLEFSPEFFGKRVATPEGVNILGIELEITRTKQELKIEGLNDGQISKIEEKADRTESGQIESIADEVKANETDKTRIPAPEDEGAEAGKEIQPVEDHRISHRPMEDGPPAHNIMEGDIAPTDIFIKPQFYIGSTKSQEPQVYEETLSAIKNLKSIAGKPNAVITIYRT
ncbi:unnamed protein product, partial [marine sediment metagenome]